MGKAKLHDIGSFIKALKGVKPQNSTGATINGAAIDRSAPAIETSFSCVLHLAVGTATGSPSTELYDAKLQQSADGSTGWTDITGAAITQLAADDSEGEVDVNLGGVERFVRAVVTVAFTGGSSPANDIAATVVLGGADILPLD